MSGRGREFYSAVLLIFICCLLGCVSGCSRNSGNQDQEEEAEAPALTEAPVQELSGGSAGEAPGGAVQETPGEAVQEGEGIQGVPEDLTPRDAPLETPPPAPSGVSEAPALVVNDIPEALRIPRRGESPRFPRDRFIGPLGRGDADAGAYRYAWGLMESLLAGESRENALSGLAGTEELIRVLDEVQPESFRMGSGQDEGDNSFSFLVRFMGSGKSSSGEVYVRLENERWTFEDMILEEEPEGEVSRFDYPSYQQFF